MGGPYMAPLHGMAYMAIPRVKLGGIHSCRRLHAEGSDYRPRASSRKRGRKRGHPSNAAIVISNQSNCHMSLYPI